MGNWFFSNLGSEKPKLSFLPQLWCELQKTWISSSFFFNIPESHPCLNHFFLIFLNVIGFSWKKLLFALIRGKSDQNTQNKIFFGKVFLFLLNLIQNERCYSYLLSCVNPISEEVLLCNLSTWMLSFSHSAVCFDHAYHQKGLMNNKSCRGTTTTFGWVCPDIISCTQDLLWVSCFSLGVWSNQ